MQLMGTQADHLPYNKHAKQHEDQCWMIMKPDDQVTSSSDSSVSTGSLTSSSDLVDDASSTNSSSSSSSNSNNNNGPLFELSELMEQLPIKRGLSKYYRGKSQSFTSLSRAMSIEDLAKKKTSFRKKMKACNYAGGLDVKATISKKISRGSFSYLPCSSSRSGSFLLGNNNRLPPIPIQKHF